MIRAVSVFSSLCVCLCVQKAKKAEICPTCGTSREDSAGFCGDCGLSFPVCVSKCRG